MRYIIPQKGYKKIFGSTHPYASNPPQFQREPNLRSTESIPGEHDCFCGLLSISPNINRISIIMSINSIHMVNQFPDAVT